MAYIEGLLNVVEQPSSHGNDGMERGPHGYKGRDEQTEVAGGIDLIQAWGNVRLSYLAEAVREAVELCASPELEYAQPRNA
jgi:hypothetical protein